MFTKEEAMQSSLEYFGGDELAASTFVTKYAMRDPSTGLYAEATPAEMHARIARELHRIELKYPSPLKINTLLRPMEHFRRIVPQGSPMFGIGNPYVKVSISNCVVVDSPKDNVSGIMETGKELANLFKRRCGVGVDLSSLRPDGSKVSNSAGSSTGAWSFADYYSNVCRMIGQNGRRGALMITLDVRHPDIHKFVTMKQDLTKVTGANVSVLISDDFMKAVEDGTSFTLQWPVDVPVEEATITVEEDARTLWNLINESAVRSAEPGIIFWDNYKNNCPANEYDDFKLVTVNPCSEIGLSAYDSCRLISINLKNYVIAPHQPTFDVINFIKDVKLAMRMMDDVVDLEIEYLTKIIDSSDEQEEKELFSKLREAAIKGRRTGLGTHGLADALARMAIVYGSNESFEFLDSLYRTFMVAAYEESVELAKERGPFPAFNWEVEKDNLFIKRLPQGLQDAMAKYGRRNISLLTMAPTGSVSIVSQTSSGIEPVFSNSYIRRKKINPSDTNARVDFTDGLGDKWTNFEVVHPTVQEFLDLNPSGYSSTELPPWFITAPEVDPLARVEVQGIIQKYIDHGISSTINLPKGTTVDTVKAIYEAAHRHGLKGVTIYVDGSRSGVLVNKTEASGNTIPDSTAPKRPAELPCNIHHVTVDGQKWTVLVGLLGDKPYEVFGGPSENVELPKKAVSGKIIKRKCTKANKKGRLSCYDLIVGEGEDALVVKDIAVTFSPENADYGVMTRMLSLSLRHGAPVQFIAEQLARDPDAHLYSFSKVMARVFKKYVKEGVVSGEHCSNCQAKLVFEDGCFVCKTCGNSKCS